MSPAPFRLDTARARTMPRPSRAMAEVRVPYTGEITMRLRRQAVAVLKARATEVPGGLRGVSLLVSGDELRLTVAGTGETIDAWLDHGRLVRDLAASIAQAADDLAEPSAPPVPAPGTARSGGPTHRLGHSPAST